MSAINITAVNSNFYTLNPDGSIYKELPLNTPVIKNAIGEYKLLKLEFDISGDYLSDDLTNKRIKFTPGLFTYLSTPITGLVFSFANRFEFTVTDTSDLTEYEMLLVCASGYDEDIIKNWKCTIQLIDANSFYIRFYFYQMIDDHDWMRPTGKDNHIKLLRSSKNDTVDLPGAPYSTSVYNATTQRLAYYLFMDDITDPSATKGYKTTVFEYHAGWYNRHPQNASPYFTNPVFSLERSAVAVTNLSPVYDTKIEFRITAPATKSLSRCFLWMIRTDSIDNTIDFKTNYEASFGRIITDAGTDQIDGKLYEPSTGPTNDTGNQWYVDCMVKASDLSFGEKYRFIGIAYYNSEGEYEVNSFISREYFVDSLPEYKGDGFEMIGTLKDYNREFTGNELICVVEERIKSKLQINFPSDQYKDDIFNRLGLTIPNDIRTYMPTILMEIYEEIVSGPNTTKHILDRKIFTQTSPTTYTSNTGATLTFGTDKATFEYDFRVRFESGITNLESQLNGVVLPSPTSNQNWGGRTIKIEWKLIFYYDDYASPFEESVRFIQKIKPKNYETGAKLIIEDVRKETPVLFCNTDEMCFSAKITPGIGEGSADQYKLITTVEPSTGSINNIEENETWIGSELSQMTSPKFLSQEESFSETVPAKAHFCMDPNELQLNLNYKICAIAKRVIPSIFIDALGYYSLRQMSGYNGYAIRIRRSSDDAELDIGFTGGVINQSQITSFIGISDGYVVTWYDQGINGNHFTQSLSIYQPKIANAGVIVIGENGLPAIDFLPAGAGVHLFSPLGFLNGATDISIFSVWDIVNSNNEGIFAPATANSQGLEILTVGVISRPTFLRVNGTVRNDNAGAAYQMWDDSTLSLTEIFGDPSSMSAFKNGSAVSLTDSSAMPALNFNGRYAMGLYFNVGNSCECTIQEVAIFDTNKISIRADIESDINSFYTIY